MKQLRRTNSDFGGVCGGLGNFFSLNPNFFRALFIIATVWISGWFFVLYFLLYLAIPKEETEGDE